ncbi:tripartite tricarboxylate transporter TctB family protein [Cohaesibacter haloalkalitolerans]|uniref:tripartite tricarboxylate transporter TctB family protein n=1 Tax=Cohaesibacter haloalkalitolerans TaxID=1162980 RepID=UPI000E64815D|nr:tripartite tricarboxylate transporter TctB family protein [Cohaesibacter haloalkalitolerans]
MSASATSQNEDAALTRGDRIGTLCFLALIIVIALCSVFLTFSFPQTPLPTDIGPARFPNIFAFFLIVLCVAQIVLTLKSPDAIAPTDEATPDSKPNYWRVLIGVGATVLCIYAMAYLGFEICSILYLFALMRLMGRRQYLWNGIFAVLLSASIYLVFSYGLSVPLPEITLFDM